MRGTASRMVFPKQWAMDQNLSTSWALARNARAKLPHISPTELGTLGRCPTIWTTPHVTGMYAPVTEPRCWNNDSQTWQHTQTPWGTWTMRKLRVHLMPVQSELLEVGPWYQYFLKAHQGHRCARRSGWFHQSRHPCPQPSILPGDWLKAALILSKFESAGSLEPSWTRSELPGGSKKSWERLKAHLGGRWWGVRSVRLQMCAYASYCISNHTLWKFIRILSQRHFISLPTNSHQEHVFNLLPEGFSIQIMTFLHSHRATNFQNPTMFRNLAAKSGQGMVWINVQSSEDWLQKDNFYLINYSLLWIPVPSSPLPPPPPVNTNPQKEEWKVWGNRTDD